MSRISNNKKKGKRRAAAQSDDEFDAMLAEVAASDLATPIASNIGASGSSSTVAAAIATAATARPPALLQAPASNSRNQRSQEEALAQDATIIEAIQAGDVTKLRSLGRRSFLVSSGKPLCMAGGWERSCHTVPRR
jgi:DNA-binding GntR family transcriptional regulator